MKKNTIVWICSCLLIWALQVVPAQTNEKVVGPVTIKSPAETVIYPDTDFSVTFSALQEDPAKVHAIYSGALWPASSYVSFDLASGTENIIPIKLDWVYFKPGETVIKYIPVTVTPNKDLNLQITEPNGIVVTAFKPVSANQHELAISRVGSGTQTVSLQQLTPVSGKIILSQSPLNLYFDDGATIEIKAGRPTMIPCNCDQTFFGGISGDLVVPGERSAGVSTATIFMDSDKQIAINYYIEPKRPTYIPTSTPTPSPTGTPILKGDVNSDGKVTIVDALLVARYCAGLPVAINLAQADANCDGSIIITDALFIARYSAGLEQKFCK